MALYCWSVNAVVPFNAASHRDAHSQMLTLTKLTVNTPASFREVGFPDGCMLLLESLPKAGP